ncbi:hypothetical protein GIB67_024456, partial [Kingdonia uniflora]
DKIDEINSNNPDVEDDDLTEVLGSEYPGRMGATRFGISPTLFTGVKHGEVIVQSLHEEVRALWEELVVCKELNEKLNQGDVQDEITPPESNVLPSICHTISKSVNCRIYWLSPSNIVATCFWYIDDHTSRVHGAPLGNGMSKATYGDPECIIVTEVESFKQIGLQIDTV